VQRRAFTDDARGDLFDLALQLFDGQRTDIGGLSHESGRLQEGGHHLVRSFRFFGTPDDTAIKFLAGAIKAPWTGPCQIRGNGNSA